MITALPIKRKGVGIDFRLHFSSNIALRLFESINNNFRHKQCLNEVDLQVFQFSNCSFSGFFVSATVREKMMRTVVGQVSGKRA